MLKTYKYRIYPTEEQKNFLSKSMGCARYIYNKALETKIKTYETERKSLSYFDLQNTILLQEKEEHDWLKEVHSQVLQMSLRNLDNAFKNFFHKTAKFPNFKRKSNNQSIQYPQGIKLNKKDSTIFIPKCGNVLGIIHRDFEGQIKTCTVSKTTTNKYFISILVDNSSIDLLPKQPYSDESTIALDLGIKHFATLSDGSKIENPKFLDKHLERLAILQQRLSMKTKGSKNREKARLKVAKEYEKITNSRHDFLHKLSSKLISENQAIIIEDLNVKDMIERGYKSLHRNISDAAWSTFIGYLDYKAEWYGKTIIRINRFDPSSKMCSGCGTMNNELQLSDREWTCSDCHVIHDRDINAAINIKNFGLLKPRLGRPVEPVEIISKQEALTFT